MKDNQIIGIVPATILQKMQLSTLSLRMNLLLVEIFYGCHRNVRSAIKKQKSRRKYSLAMMALLTCLVLLATLQLAISLLFNAGNTLATRQLFKYLLWVQIELRQHDQ